MSCNSNTKSLFGVGGRGISLVPSRDGVRVSSSFFHRQLELERLGELKQRFTLVAVPTNANNSSLGFQLRQLDEPNNQRPYSQYSDLVEKFSFFHLPAKTA